MKKKPGKTQGNARRAMGKDLSAKDLTVRRGGAGVKGGSLTDIVITKKIDKASSKLF